MFSAPRSATTISSDCFFFFNDPATTEIYTLSLHDALPISLRVRPFTRALLPPRGLLLRLRLARLVGTGSGRPFLLLLRGHRCLLTLAKSATTGIVDAAHRRFE